VYCANVISFTGTKATFAILFADEFKEATVAFAPVHL
jgi:hypothetical protein